MFMSWDKTLQLNLCANTTYKKIVFYMICFYRDIANKTI